MKKIIVVLAVIALLALAQVGQAVDLQAGWYVKLGAVELDGYDPQTHTGLATVWHFSGAFGDYPPFSISSPDPYWAERMVSVPTSISGVAPGTSVYLWGEPVVPISYDVTMVGLYWETNYDVSVMQLELLMYNPDNGYTKLWSQSRSGHNSDMNDVLTFPQRIPVGYVPVFRVSVVPEPSGILILLNSGGAFFGLLRIRRRIQK